MTTPSRPPTRRHRVAALLVALALLAVAGPPAEAATSATSGGVVTPAAAAAAGPGLVTVTPTRLLDTRSGIGAPAGRVGAGGAVSLAVLGVAGVPSSGVAAVVLNVTAVDPSAPGYVTVHAAGSPVPGTSSLNHGVGAAVPDLVVVAPGAGGRVTLQTASAGSVHLLVDVQGWWPVGAGLTPVPPARVLDTRTGTGAPAGRLGAAGTLDLQVAGRGGVPSSGAAAVLVTVTAVDPTAATWISAVPRGVAPGATSNLNTEPGRTRAALVLVPLGTGGRITLSNAVGSTHLLADVVAWLPSAPGADLVTTTPARQLDTRSAVGAAAGRMAAGVTADLRVLGRGGVPSGAGAVVLTVTVTEPLAAGFLTAWPAGSRRPEVSNVNWAAGQTVANLVVVPVGPGGKVSLRTSAGAHVVADVAGWLPGAPRPLDVGSATLLSAAPDGLQALRAGVDAFGGPVSGDGRTAVTTVWSPEPLGPPTTSVRDVATGEHSSAATVPAVVYELSDDGRTGLVWGYRDGPGAFVADTASGAVRRVDLTPDGSPSAEQPSGAALSGDGRYVTFSSPASDVVPGVTGGVFQRDLVLGRTTWVGSCGAAATSTTHCWVSDSSGNGRFVVYSTLSAERDPVLWLWDRASGASREITPSAGGRLTPGAAEVSDDGRTLAFLARADADGAPNVFVHDVPTGVTTLVSAHRDGRPGAASWVDLSRDGSTVVLQTNIDLRAASSPTGWVSHPAQQVYAYDVATRVLRLVTTAPDEPAATGAACPADSVDPQLVADGSAVAFRTWCPLVPNMVRSDFSWDTPVAVLLRLS